MKGAAGVKGAIMQGGKGRGSMNMVWRPPGSAASSETEAKAKEAAALQKKIDTPLAYHSAAYTPYGGAWTGAGRGRGMHAGFFAFPVLESHRGDTVDARIGKRVFHPLKKWPPNSRSNHLFLYPLELARVSWKLTTAAHSEWTVAGPYPLRLL